MLRISGVVLALICILCAFRCGPVHAGNEASSVSEARDGAAPVRLLSVVDVPPGEMRRALAGAYRLKPDRRFLLAVAQVQRLFSGQVDAGVASAEFCEDHWRISYKGQDVGTLPELPDFSDLLGLLQNWVRALQQKEPIEISTEGDDPTDGEIMVYLDGFHVPDLAVALRKVDEVWRKGSRHPSLLRVAARGLVLMVVQSMDTLEINDLLPARALAALAAATVLAGDPCSREEALLAVSMGYSVHAAAVALRLSESDPVRLYVAHDDENLKTHALQNRQCPAEARYLYLLRLAQRREADSLMAWIKACFPTQWIAPPIFKTGLELKKFSSDPVLSEAMPRLVLVDLAREVDVLPEVAGIVAQLEQTTWSTNELAHLIRTLREVSASEPDGMRRRFELGLDGLEHIYRGPFLDFELYQDYYQGYFYSALHDLGLRYLESLSSLEAYDRFSAVMGKPGTGVAGDFLRWYRCLFALREGRGASEELSGDLTGLFSLGVPPLVVILEEQGKAAVPGMPALLRSVRSLTARMDTRASHRRFLGLMAQTHLIDLRLMEAMFDSAQSVDGYRDQSLMAWYASYRGDTEALIALLRIPDYRVEVKAGILQYLQDLKGTSPDVIENECRWLIKEFPDRYDLRAQYAGLLLRERRYEDARHVVTEWLDRKDAGPEFDRVLARTALASIAFEEGQYRKGWKMIEPLARSHHDAALVLASRLLDALGRPENAEKTARVVVVRHPAYVEGRALLAGIYWRHGKYEEAAEVLKSAPRPIPLENWQDLIAREFVDVFSNASSERVTRAFHALMARGFDPFDLACLAVPFAKRGQYETAFGLMRALSAGGIEGMDSLDLAVMAYRYLKQAKGGPEALDWLRQQIPPQKLHEACIIFFRQGESDLLWDLVPDPAAVKHPGFVWLMRAAASARMGTGRDPHFPEVLAHYYPEPNGLSSLAARLLELSQGEGASFQHTLGCFLVGRASENEVLVPATEAGKRASAAYWLGLRAQGEGRYGDASDWYRVAVETGLTQAGEGRWAYETLLDWRSKGRSLERIAGEASGEGGGK